MLTLSFENSSFTLLGQYLTGRGDRMGTLIDTTNSSSYNYSGFSLFGLAKIFENWRVWGRYDSFKPSLKQLNDNSQRMIIAVGYDFGNQNILLIDYDWLKFRSENTNVIKLTMQMNFEYALDFTKKVKH
jgi:hypothetical protein